MRVTSWGKIGEGRKRGVIMSKAAADSGVDTIRRWDSDVLRKIVEDHHGWIKGLAARVAETATYRPYSGDLKRDIARLSEAIPSGGPGRPRSPRVDGARLRELRNEARLSQVTLAESAGVDVKSLRGYEHSQPGDGANLTAIADVLSDSLKRTLTVADLTF